MNNYPETYFFRRRLQPVVLEIRRGQLRAGISLESVCRCVWKYPSLLMELSRNKRQTPSGLLLYRPGGGKLEIRSIPRPDTVNREGNSSKFWFSRYTASIFSLVSLGTKEILRCTLSWHWESFRQSMAKRASHSKSDCSFLYPYYQLLKSYLRHNSDRHPTRIGTCTSIRNK